VTLPLEAPATKRQSLVSVGGVDFGYWSTKTGGEVSSSVTEVWDGGAARPSKLASPATTKNIVLSKPYRNSQDQALCKRLTGLVGIWVTTVTVQDTDASLIPVGEPTVYPGSLLMRVQPPDHDASSGDGKMLEIEFSPTDTV
jgi:hypothetical protein